MWTLYHSYDKFVNIAMERAMFGFVLLPIYYIYLYRYSLHLKIFLQNKKFPTQIKWDNNERKENKNEGYIQTKTISK